MKSTFKFSVLLLALFVISPFVMAQYHPMPGSDKEPTVLCTGCLGTNVHGEKNAGLPTYAYTAPVAKHVGRLVDSANTKSVQHGSAGGTNLRSVRAGFIHMAPAQRGSAPPRAYIQMGGAVAAYALNTFFTTTLPGGMVSLSTLGVSPGSRAPLQIERVAKWDAFIYPERDQSLYGVAPGLPLLDKQEILFDADADDRGFVYAAYSSFGWGYMRDSGEGGATLLQKTAWSFEAASLVFSLKVGSAYYAIVSNSQVPSPSSHSVYDVSIPGSLGTPIERGGSPAHGIVGWVKNDAAGRLAVIDGNQQLKIYDYAAFINGGGPITGPISATTGSFFKDVTVDEAGNFWAIENSHGYPETSIHRFAPTGATYVKSTFKPYGELFKGLWVSAAAGFVAVAGEGSSGSDLMLFKVEGGDLKKVDLKYFFNRHYHYAPRGYAQPNAGDVTETTRPMGVQLFKHTNNKVYLIYNAGGIGDVFELEAGDSISASMRTNGFGKVNPNSKATEVGPFVGDVVRFTAAASSSARTHRVSWDFDNPESSRNLAESNTGADISHQFGGYSTVTEITRPKKVKATVTTDANLSDTVTVNLKVPTARIGRTGSTVPITAAGTAFDVVYGDTFNDASDGSVESHYASWSIDGGASSKQLPTGSVDVGVLGPHSVTLQGMYGAYDPSTLTSVATPYVAAVTSVPYVVRPFIFTLASTKSGTDAVFSASARVTSNAQVLNATAWTVTWSLKDNAGIPVGTQPGPQTVALGTIPSLAVPMSVISAATKPVVTLEVSVPTAGLTGPAEYATYSRTMTLDKPQPAVTKTGCDNANAPCTFTASSAVAGVSIADWTFSWTLLKDGSPVESAVTGNPYKPAITQSGHYTVTVTATKGIFEGTVSSSFTVAAPVCGPPPGPDQLTMNVKCPGDTCDAGEAITFQISLYHYTRQPCDVFTWNFGTTSKTGSPVTHTYSTNGTYTVSLSASNSSGSAATVVSQQVTVGGGGVIDPPDPPPTCTRPTNIEITYSGPGGCGSGNPCKVGDRINFTASKNNGSPITLGCDTASWNFGDSTTGSGGAPRKTYDSAGTYTVTLNVSSSGGAATPVSVNVTIVPSSTGSCTWAATADNLVLEFRGADSNCSVTNGTICRRGESIKFDVKTFGGYTFQSCDKFEWTFGDGSGSALKNPTHAYAGSSAEYIASLRVYNTSNPTGVTLSMRVPFDNAPIVPTPAIQLSVPASAAKGQAITFTADSNLDTTTGWTWDFGDGTAKDTSQAGIVSRTSTVTHVFTTAGTRTITVSARNSLSTSTALTAISTNQVTVSDVPVHKFLLPAVIHAGGLNGSSWRTDVQVYYGAPNPAAQPLKMTASFNGVETQLEINRSTFIYDDIVSSLTNGAGGQGTIILTTQTPYKPQIWTRTYNVDPSGKTFGQFIPAVELAEAAGNTPNAQPNRYYLSGLRNDSRYRTNVGLINTTTSDVIADVTAYDDLQTPLDRFSVTLSPFALQQFGVSKVKNLTNRPVSLEISVPAGKRIVGYASLIDGASNDPVYISATSDAELASPDYATSIIPGVGHIGAWRSDVTIFNPDDRSPVTFDLAYYDAAGLRRGLATNLTLGPLQAKNYEDLLRVNNLFSPTPPDGVGMLKLTALSQQARYPLTFSRTYNDKGAGGTFGQGIAGVAAVRANVVPGKSAIIAGVRSGANYKTNIGLTNTTSTGVNVRVQLLDPITGSVAHEESYSLVGDASVVGTFPFPATLTQGALRINITAGAGGVWAFASVIDTKSEDPEYVPATPIQ